MAGSSLAGGSWLVEAGRWLEVYSGTFLSA